MKSVHLTFLGNLCAFDSAPRSPVLENQFTLGFYCHGFLITLWTRLSAYDPKINIQNHWLTTQVCSECHSFIVSFHYNNLPASCPVTCLRVPIMLSCLKPFLAIMIFKFSRTTYFPSTVSMHELVYISSNLFRMCVPSPRYAYPYEPSIINWETLQSWFFGTTKGLLLAHTWSGLLTFPSV